MLIWFETSQIFSQKFLVTFYSGVYLCLKGSIYLMAVSFSLVL